MMDLRLYLSNFEGRSGASSILVPADKLVRLPDQPCKFAMLSNFNIQNDSAFTLKASGTGGLYQDIGEEVYYGFNGIVIAQLFPAESTQLLPVNNLDQVCLRTRPGDSITIWYAWFW